MTPKRKTEALWHRKEHKKRHGCMVLEGGNRLLRGVRQWSEKQLTILDGRKMRGGESTIHPLTHNSLQKAHSLSSYRLSSGGSLLWARPGGQREYVGRNTAQRATQDRLTKSRGLTLWDASQHRSNMIRNGSF